MKTGRQKIEAGFMAFAGVALVLGLIGTSVAIFGPPALAVLMPAVIAGILTAVLS